MAAFTPVNKNGVRYHFYPKGRNGSGRPEYIPVKPPKDTMSKKSSGGPMSVKKQQPTGAKMGPKTQVTGQAAPAAGAQAAAGAAPGAPAPSPAVIDPFLRPEDLQALADFNFETGNALADIDRGLADLGTQTAYDRVNTDKAAKQGTSDATDSAISRGLFQSSIKDATLYDIEGQRVRSQQLFTDRQNNATLDADRRKALLRQAQDALAERMRQQAVANAREVSAAQAVAVPTAAPGVPGKATPVKAAVAKAATSAKPKPAVGMMMSKKKPAGSMMMGKKVAGG